MADEIIEITIPDARKVKIFQGMTRMADVKLFYGVQYPGEKFIERRFSIDAQSGETNPEFGKRFIIEATGGLLKLDSLVQDKIRYNNDVEAIDPPIAYSGEDFG